MAFRAETALSAFLMPDLEQDIDYEDLEETQDPIERDPGDGLGLLLPPVFAFLPLCLMQ
jgi:hypothetical protein